MVDPPTRHTGILLVLTVDFSVPNAREYYPLSTPTAGTALSSASSFYSCVCIPNTDHGAQQNEFLQNRDLPKLFQPLAIRGVTFKNRLWVVGLFVLPLWFCSIQRDLVEGSNVPV